MTDESHELDRDHFLSTQRMPEWAIDEKAQVNTWAFFVVPGEGAPLALRHYLCPTALGV